MEASRAVPGTTPAAGRLLQSMDWTQLPDACRINIAQHMDGLTRAAWRTVSRQCCQDVHVFTRSLTWLGTDKRHMRLAPQPAGTSPSTQVPAAILAKLLAKLPHLHHLQCTRMLSLDSIPSTLPSTLVSLDLTYCWHFSDLAPVQACTSLQRLLLSAGGKSIHPLITSLQSITPTVAPSLTYLSLTTAGNFDFDSIVTETLVAALQRLNRLQHLHLTLGDDGWSTLWVPLSSVLPLMPDLVTLDLSQCNMGEAGVSTLAPAIARLQRLQCLLLAGNGCELTGAEALSRAAASLPGLTHLDLANSYLNCIRATMALVSLLRALPGAPLRSLRLCGNHIEEPGMEALGPALALHTALTELDLGSCWLGDEGVVRLAEVLGPCTGLCSLRLPCNWITDRSFDALAPRLRAWAPSLTSLCLADSRMPQSAYTLAEVLRGLTRLTTLDIAVAFYSPPGTSVDMADTLQALTNLQQLVLCVCMRPNIDGPTPTVAPIGVSGPLIGAFQTMPQLRNLSLRMNPCSVGVQALVAAVPSMGSLRKLEVDAEGLSPEDQQLLKAAIDKL